MYYHGIHGGPKADNDAGAIIAHAVRVVAFLRDLMLLSFIGAVIVFYPAALFLPLPSLRLAVLLGAIVGAAYAIYQEFFYV
jgi:hypothetical protein